MFNRVEAKEAAKDMLRGNWLRVGALFLLIFTVIFFMNWLPIIGRLGYLITMGAFVLSTVIIGLKVSDGIRVDIEDSIVGFKHFIKALGLFWWQGLWVFLWSLLLIIPGIIKAYSYQLCFYVLAENPDMTVMEALDESKRLTQGHKWDLFVLDLSFIGWGLLASLTFGVGYFWLIPYMQVTSANVYKQIRG